MTVIFKGDNLWAKVRYNIHHAGTGLEWRIFIKDGDKDEIMFLCKNICFYVEGKTFKEVIDGVGHFSILYKAPRIVIDENQDGWILAK